MSETILIITLVTSIIMPIITSLSTLGIYVVRKLRKSSCFCFNFESNDEVLNKDIDFKNINIK